MTKITENKYFSINQQMLIEKFKVNEISLITYRVQAIQYLLYESIWDIEDILGFTKKHARSFDNQI